MLHDTQRQVTPTPTGEKIIAQARLVLAAADKIYELASKHRDPLAGTLRLGIIPTLGPYLMPKLITDPAERARALALCEQIAGPIEEMSPATVALFNQFKAVLNVEEGGARKRVEGSGLISGQNNCGR